MPKPHPIISRPPKQTYNLDDFGHGHLLAVKRVLVFDTLNLTIVTELIGSTDRTLNCPKAPPNERGAVEGICSIL